MFRYCELLMPFLASAMVTSAAFKAPEAVAQTSIVDHGWRAAGWSLEAPAPSVILAASSRKDSTAAKPPISPEKLRNLMALILSTRDVQPVSQNITTGLGLTYPFMRKNALYDVDGIRHSMSVGISDPTRMIFFLRTPAGIWLYASTLQLELVSAATLVNGVVTPVTVESAKAGFEAELRAWDRAPLAD